MTSVTLARQKTTPGQAYDDAMGPVVKRLFEALEGSKLSQG